MIATLRPRATVYLNLSPDPDLPLQLDEDELVERCHAFAAFLSLTVREGDTLVERSPLPPTSAVAGSGSRPWSIRARCST